jgi:hypothetical protein
VRLGIALGAAGLDGRDKVTILASPQLADFGAWAEQLLAESTGKRGRGLIPVDSESLGTPDVYGPDRFFIEVRTKNESDATHEAALGAIEKAGHPVVRIVLRSAEHIGQEFFRFEFATAVAGALLAINPFDQPDVEASKARTRELTAAFENAGALPADAGALEPDHGRIYRRNECRGVATSRRGWRSGQLAQGALRPRPPGRLCGRAGLPCAKRRAYRNASEAAARIARSPAHRHVSRLRAAVPAFDRSSP